MKQMVEGLSVEELKNFFTHTQSFINHVHHVRHDFNLKPHKDHIGACINYVDLKEYRQEFVNELVYTITEWVYSQSKANNMIGGLMNEDGRSIQNAYSRLRSLAFKKFRRSQADGDKVRLLLQGQFGELLLFNFLQYFYDAVPLLRKMPLTTTEGNERFGADAIHYKKEKEKNILILGESKAYTYDKQCQFNKAFKDALTSITNTYNSFNDELDLYTYEDFLDTKLEHIAKAYKSGILKNVEIQLVSLVAYNEKEEFEKESETQIKSKIINIISDRCKNLDDTHYIGFSGNEKLVNRIDYIIFPIWKLEELISEFKKAIGA